MSEHPRIYLARAGRSGEDEDRALENNIATVGFREVPSLAGATDYDGVHGIVSKAFSDAKPRAVGNFAGQLWAFAVAMKEGDLVVLPRKLTSQIAIGRVAVPYEYRQMDDTFRHTRPVEWLQTDLPRTVFGQDLLNSPADVTVYRTLQGAMQTFKAEQGLLVCWGGFNKVVLTEARTGHFSVRLWDSGDLVEVIYRTYERLPAEAQAELPLKRAWMLVVDESED